MFIIIAEPSSSRRPMKFDFEIKQNLPFLALVAIAIVAFSSGSLASIATALGDPLTGQFCALVLMVIVLLALRYHHPWIRLLILTSPPAADGGNMALGSAQSRRSASLSIHRSNAGLRDSINNNSPFQRSQTEHLPF